MCLVSSSMGWRGRIVLRTHRHLNHMTVCGQERREREDVHKYIYMRIYIVLCVCAYAGACVRARACVELSLV